MFYMRDREIIFSAGGFYRKCHHGRKILTVGERINFWDHGTFFLFPPTQKHFSSLKNFLNEWKNSYGYKYLKDCL